MSQALTGGSSARHVGAFGDRAAHGRSIGSAWFTTWSV